MSDNVFGELNKKSTRKEVVDYIDWVNRNIIEPRTKYTIGELLVVEKG